MPSMLPLHGAIYRRNHSDLWRRLRCIPIALILLAAATFTSNTSLITTAVANSNTFDATSITHSTSPAVIAVIIAAALHAGSLDVARGSSVTAWRT